tara:strand:- start:343 stop:495 length:153 start_codon:yes stop_codon:yes gene_type:complete
METILHFFKHLIGLCGETHPSLLVSGVGFFSLLIVYLGDILNYLKDKINV